MYVADKPQGKTQTAILFEKPGQLMIWLLVFRSFVILLSNDYSW